jgi:AcrR family transcriptional regulator
VSPASTRRRAASSPAAPLRRRDEARALFRNAILEAAEAVFGETGFHRARIQDVAARARIAVGTVYNHFDDKDEVLRALMEERIESMLEELQARPDDPSDFEGRLITQIQRMLRYVDAHRAFFAIASEQGLFGASSASASALGGKAARNVARARSMFLAMAEDGVAAGALEAIDPADIARALGGIVRSFALGALHEGPRASVENDAALIARLFLHGAASKGAPRASKRPR